MPDLKALMQENLGQRIDLPTGKFLLFQKSPSFLWPGDINLYQEGVDPNTESPTRCLDEFEEVFVLYALEAGKAISQKQITELQAEVFRLKGELIF